MKRVLLVGGWLLGAMLFGPVSAQAGTLTVNSGGDAGGTCPGATCTLRQAILDATPGDTIDFAPGLTTIDLTSAELFVNKNLTISGPGADLLAVQRSTASGTPNFRIFNIASANVTISGLTISNGNASDPGGGGILNSNGSTVNITSSTLSDNFAFASSGGGGGGIYNSYGSTVNARNSIIATNIGNNDFYGTLTSQGYNLIGSTGGTTITGISTGNQLNVDPMLSSLQDNGGPTFTHALLSGSTAIDRGHSSGSTTDQRGFPRPIDHPAIPNAAGGDGSEIGAYEEQTLTPVPTPTPSPPPAAQALNLSTRMFVQTGDSVGIGGFIIAGSVPKRVLLRAVGPTLSQFGVPNPLADPVMELHGPPGFATIINDNCVPSQIIGPPPYCQPGSLDAMIDATLAPGAYTAIVRGKNNTTGVALLEVYDFNQAASSKLANISTRAFVGTADNIVIAGFILGGNSAYGYILIRGIGPSLTGFGVPNALADPTLQLLDSNGTLISSNNDWQDNPTMPVLPPGLRPTNNLESAILATLPAGPYTALLAGRNNGTGVGLVEVYDLVGPSGTPGPTPTPGTPTPSPPASTPTPPPSPSPTSSPGITPSPTPPQATPTPSEPGHLPCAQNFDLVTAPALPPGWSGSWVTSTIDPDTAPNAAFVPNPATISDESLFSPFISINSASAVMVFRNNFNTEHDPPPAEVFRDGYVLEVSTDGGATYNDILNVGGVFVSGAYTGEIDGSAFNPLAGRMAWSGNSGGYIDTVINLPTSFNGETIRLRFRMGTDEAGGAPGVRIDGFVVTTALCP